MEDGREDALILNLRLASSYFESTSMLCRKLEINRQQFMKYLSGRSYPSRRNMRRICDFLGFDEHELLMPHDQFREIIRLRPIGSLHELELPSRLMNVISGFRRSDSKPVILAGFYFQYYFSFSVPGSILRTLVHVYDWHGYTLFKRVERLRSPVTGGTPDIYKYDGFVIRVGDKIHMIDQETITKTELSHAVLYPSYRNRRTILTGLMIGVSGKGAHQPSASRVLLEFVGRTVNRRRAMEGCQLFSADALDLPEVVQEYLFAAPPQAGPPSPPGPIQAH